MSNLELRRDNLRLFSQTNPRADRETALEIVLRRIPGRGADQIHGGRIVVTQLEERGFQALVAAIRQRDAADGRATFWERAFFILTLIAGTASAALVVTWMKGGFDR